MTFPRCAVGQGGAVSSAGPDAGLAGRLVARQFPRWAGLPVAEVPSTGTDNAIFRLGDDLAVRLPRSPFAAAAVDREHRWLPGLAPLLPFAALRRADPAGGPPSFRGGPVGALDARVRGEISEL